jgi:hypothetical protein
MPPKIAQSVKDKQGGTVPPQGPASAPANPPQAAVQVPPGS